MIQPHLRRIDEWLVNAALLGEHDDSKSWRFLFGGRRPGRGYTNQQGNEQPDGVCFSRSKSANCAASYVLASIVIFYSARRGVISRAQMAIGRMYIPARKFPVMSHASGVRNQ